MLGTKLAGRYKIVRHLGGGGFGQTYVAEDTHLPGNPHCIIKQLQPVSTHPESLNAARELFDREAQVLYRLGKHDRIPHLLAHFEEGAEFFLAQDLIEGHVLSQELYDGKIYPESYVVQLLLDLLSVLEFVHQQNVIHRDIKPSNLIRRAADKRIVLIDFGAVKEVSIQSPNRSSQTSTVVVGSPGYMANEQYSGKAQYASDLYSAGIIAIQALTGLPPDRIPEDPRTSELQWRDRAAVSPELAEMLDRMVRFDYRQRYQSAMAVLQDLRTLEGCQEEADLDILSGLPADLRTFAQQLTTPQTTPASVARELERGEDPVRLKKFIYLVCSGVLESDLYKLEQIDFPELIATLYEQSPTADRLRARLIEVVKTISPNKQRQYLLVAKEVFAGVAKLYRQVKSAPLPAADNLADNLTDNPAATGTPPTPYELAARQLAKQSDLVRVKKLLQYACRNEWESDPEKLERLELVQLLEELVDFAPSLDQLCFLFEDVIRDITKPAEYAAIADDIIRAVQELYAAKEQAAVDHHPREVSKPVREVPLAEAIDLFDLRLEVMKFTSPMSSKILLYSLLYGSFQGSDRDWTTVKSLSLDTLLSQAFVACRHLTELETKLTVAAAALTPPDRYQPVTRQLIRALKPAYEKLPELAKRSPATSDETSISVRGSNEDVTGFLLSDNPTNDSDDTCQFM